MKTSSKIALIAALVLLLGSGVFWIIGQNTSTKSPEQLINESLRDAEDAAQRGSVSGVMDVVSDDFASGTWNKARLRLLLTRTLQQGRGTSYDVRVNAPTVSPSPRGNPDERVVMTRFSAFYSGSSESIYNSGNQPVLLVMRRETERKWLIFRQPRWRIISVPQIAPLLGGAGEM